MCSDLCKTKSGCVWDQDKGKECKPAGYTDDAGYPVPCEHWVIRVEVVWTVTAWLISIAKDKIGKPHSTNAKKGQIEGGFLAV